LTVNITAWDIRGDQDFLQALLPHVPRISHLSLTRYLSIGDVAHDLPGFLAITMPNITSLELEQEAQTTELFRSKATTAPPLFQNLSNLKSLHLTRVSDLLILSDITSLVELKLEGYTIPFGKFIGFLGSNLALEIVVLDLGFVKSSVRTVPERRISLPQLRRLEFTCDNAADARGLLSCVSLPRGIHVTVQGARLIPCADLVSFLPSPPTRIQELLTPITTIKYWDFPRQLHLSSDGGTFHFQSPHNITPTLYEEFKLFATDAVREFHLNLHRQHPTKHLSWSLERLPVLEALVISETLLSFDTLSPLGEEPTLCPSLKTVAFFNCSVGQRAIGGLREALAKREHSIAARLHQVIIVDSGFNLPDIPSIRQLQELVPRVNIRVGDRLPDLL
jgi:hypothetical protein